MFTAGKTISLFKTLILLASIISTPANVRADEASLSDHPLYSKYKFGQSGHTIDFGVQPISIPIGVISAVIEEDRLLLDELSAMGIEIRYHQFYKGSDLNHFVERGDLELGLAGDMPALVIATKTDLVIATLSKHGFTSFISDKHMLIKELRGKRIGFPFGSNAHYSLLQVLAGADVNEKDVILVPQNVNLLPVDFENGRIDMFVSWEPITTMALVQNKGLNINHRSLSTSYMYFTKAFVEAQPEVSRLIVAAQVRAMMWMYENDDNLHHACGWAFERKESFLKEANVLTTKQCADIMKNDLLDVALIPLVPESDLLPDGRLAREFKFLKNLGKIQRSVTWDVVRLSFDNTLLNEVLEDQKKYQLRHFSYGF